MPLYQNLASNPTQGATSMFSGTRVLAGNGSTAPYPHSAEFWAGQYPGVRWRAFRSNSSYFTRAWNSPTDGIMPMSIVSGLADQSVSLDPAIIILAGPSGTVEPGAISINLTPASVVLVAPSITSGEQFALGTPGVVTLIAPPGLVNQGMLLSPGTLTLSAPAFADIFIDQLVTLSPAVLTLVVPALTVTYGLLEVDLDPAIIYLTGAKLKQQLVDYPARMLMSETYLFYLNNPTYGLLALPAQSAQATISFEGSISMSVSCPGGAAIAGDMANYFGVEQIEVGATQLSLLRKRVYANGAQIYETIASGPATNYDFNRGPQKYVFTLRSSEVSPHFSGTVRNFTNVMSVAASNGLMRMRVPLDLEVQPLDTVTYVPSGQTFIVGSITYTLGIAQTYMDLSELAA